MRCIMRFNDPRGELQTRAMDKVVLAFHTNMECPTIVNLSFIRHEVSEFF